jgi:hypothetical protein
MSSSTFFLYVGSALILHSAYSLLHYRELLQELQDSAVGTSASVSYSSSSTTSDASSSLLLLAQPPDLPSDVIIEVVVGFTALLISEMIRPGSALRPIASTSGGTPHQQRQPVVAPVYVSRDWDIYSTRAKAF